MSDFKDSEFECKCGCGLGINDMNERSVDRLRLARGCAGIPFVLNRAISCPPHNISVGGKKNSSHVTRSVKNKACAFDIAVQNSRSRWRILKGLIDAGFTRIGIGDNFIHADDDQTKDPCVIWMY